MGIYTNQAQRIMDFICKKMEISQADYERIFKLNVPMLENRIEVVITTTGKNGKDAADLIIDQFIKADPDFEKQHTFNNVTFTLRIFLKEVHVVYESPKGAFMSNYPYTGTITTEQKDEACKQCLEAYNKKWGAIA